MTTRLRTVCRWAGIAGLLIGSRPGFTEPASADVLHLRNGQAIEGTVTGYANLAFQFYPPGGKKIEYQTATIDRIEFEARPELPTLDYRSKGPVRVRVTGYHDAAFSFDEGNGRTGTVSAILIASARFGEPARPKDSGPEPITRGDEVDVAAHLVAGKVTVVDFYGEFDTSNVASRLVTKFLENLAAQDREVVLVKVNIGAWESPVARQYQVTAIPRVEVYNRLRQRIASIEGNRPPDILTAIKKAKK